MNARPIPSQRILVAEDEPNLSKLNSEVLRVCGYQVDNAKNGLTAMHKLNDDRFDLAIVEEELPKVTGLELVNALRSNDIRTPVILLMGTTPVKEPKPEQGGASSRDTVQALHRCRVA